MNGAAGVYGDSAAGEVAAPAVERARA